VVEGGVSGSLVYRLCHLCLFNLCVNDEEKLFDVLLRMMVYYWGLHMIGWVRSKLICLYLSLTTDGNQLK
jgi:hypothetical protein